MTRFLLRPCLALLLALAPAGLFPAAAVEAIYQVTQTGIAVVEITAQFESRPDGYLMRSVSRAVGIGKLFAPHEIRSEVEGTWRAEGVAPQRFQAEGNWRGDARRTVLLYRDGMPQPLEMEPPAGITNEPVPLPARRGAIDGLSAFALMSRTVAQTGRCRFLMAGDGWIGRPGPLDRRASPMPGGKLNLFNAGWKAGWSPGCALAMTLPVPNSLARLRHGSPRWIRACRPSRSALNSQAPSSAP
jgi:hypothetical protein